MSYECTKLSGWAWLHFLGLMGLTFTAAILAPGHPLALPLAALAVLMMLLLLIAPSIVGLQIRHRFRMTPDGLEVKQSGPGRQQDSRTIAYEQIHALDLRLEPRRRPRERWRRSFLVVTLGSGDELTVLQNRDDREFQAFVAAIQNRLPHLPYRWNRADVGWEKRPKDASFR